ncbi:hypothetical protein [Streptomyces vinaceus]|uniref:hypothetical protein n=1 Tax=Streptomyces vinaceus TaxID=1960 RepID=UPI00123E464D|nr:hypothetical protein [Streptomyces vinaceus]
MKRNPGRVVIAGFAVIAATAYCLAAFAFPAGESHAVLMAVGEAFGVALLLLAAGHLYLNQKMQSDSVGLGVETAIGQIFGFFHPSQPEDLRVAVRSLAQEPIYFDVAKWVLRFEWEGANKDCLRVTITFAGRGKCVSKGGFLFGKDLWALTSTHSRGNRKQTEYLHYGLHCPESDISVNEGREALRSYTHPDGSRLRLDQSRLLSDKAPGRKIDQGKWFDFDRETCMYRRAVDFIPLMHSRFEKTFELEVTGNALGEMSIICLHPSEGASEWTYPQRLPESPANPSFRKAKWERVTPGQTTIVSWHLRSEAVAAATVGEGVNRVSPIGM